MPEFRIFYLDASSDRITASHDFSADDDLDAIQRAGEFRTFAPMELWSGDRKIKRWEASDQDRPV